MHSAVLLFGITAILGKLISLNSLPLVWNRLWIAVIGLLFIPGAIRGLRQMTRKNIFLFSGIGLVVALHWITFYGSVKLGDSASVTLACMATASLFTSILEPLITKSKFQPIELVLGILVIIGILFLTGVGSAYYLAIAVGLISAFLAALFSTLNKKHLGSNNSISVSVLELSSGFILISLLSPVLIWLFPKMQWMPIKTDWLYLLILGLLCTSVAYVLALSALKHLSAFVSNLSVNLEPVYGILLAIWLLNEDKDLNTQFYIGTGIILLAVLLHPILVKVKKRRDARY